MHSIQILVYAVFSSKVEWRPSRKETSMAKTMESSSPVTPKPRTASNQPTREEIALRAYHIYLKRDGAPGNEFEDWMQAERQLIVEIGKPHRKVTAKSAAA
jgi:Protein of unknown function (DUF2934)